MSNSRERADILLCIKHYNEKHTPDNQIIVTNTTSADLTEIKKLEDVLIPRNQEHEEYYIQKHANQAKRYIDQILDLQNPRSHEFPWGEAEDSFAKLYDSVISWRKELAKEQKVEMKKMLSEDRRRKEKKMAEDKIKSEERLADQRRKERAKLIAEEESKLERKRREKLIAEEERKLEKKKNGFIEGIQRIRQVGYNWDKKREEKQDGRIRENRRMTEGKGRGEGEHLKRARSQQELRMAGKRKAERKSKPSGFQDLELVKEAMGRGQGEPPHKTRDHGKNEESAFDFLRRYGASKNKASIVAQKGSSRDDARTYIEYVRDCDVAKGAMAPEAIAGARSIKILKPAAKESAAQEPAVNRAPQDQEPPLRTWIPKQDTKMNAENIHGLKTKVESLEEAMEKARMLHSEVKKF